jgi:hypothetical protein
METIVAYVAGSFFVFCALYVVWHSVITALFGRSPEEQRLRDFNRALHEDSQRTKARLRAAGLL